jgi:hypothetical protein
MTRPLPILYVANAAKIGGGNRVLMDIVSGLNRERFTPLIVTPGPGPLADWADDHRIDVEVIPDGDWARRTAAPRGVVRAARHGARRRPRGTRWR